MSYEFTMYCTQLKRSPYLTNYQKTSSLLMVLFSHRKERYQMYSIVVYFLLTIAICSSPCSPVTLTPELLDKPRCLNLTTTSRANQAYWDENRFYFFPGIACFCVTIFVQNWFVEKEPAVILFHVLYRWFGAQLRAAATRIKQVTFLLSHPGELSDFIRVRLELIGHNPTNCNECVASWLQLCHQPMALTKLRSGSPRENWGQE